LTEAPFATAHASTIAATPESVIAAWFGGPHEGHPQVRIWLSHKANSGWSTPVEVARGTDRRGRPQPCWNPVLHQAAGRPALAVLQGRAEPTALVGYVAHLR
jgi:predicted neuraminidase